MSEFAQRAEQFQKISITHHAKKAGRSKKADDLQLLIREIVRRNPRVTAAELKEKLTRDRYPDVITDVDDDYIYFKANGEAEKQAKISGLKDRLSRAKRAPRSR